MEANKAMQPVPVAVTPRAEARDALSTPMADLGRLAKRTCDYSQLSYL